MHTWQQQQYKVLGESFKVVLRLFSVNVKQYGKESVVLACVMLHAVTGFVLRMLFTQGNVVVTV